MTVSKVPNNVWSVPVYLPYLQPRLTQETINGAERALGVTLPASYLELLREQNGGYVRLQLPDVVDSMIWGIGPHFPNLVGGQWWHRKSSDIAPNDEQDEAWCPDDPNLLIAFDGDGHWHHCFDYRDCAPTDEPAITFVDFESEVETVIAINFDSYLALLEENISPNTFGIVSDAPIEAIVDALEPELGAKFDPPDSDAQGYPVHRCAFGTPQTPEWLWLSANEVPRGFVRASEPRFDELVNLLPGTGLRMPDHAQFRYFFECTDGVVERVISASQRAGMRVRRLRTED